MAKKNPKKKARTVNQQFTSLERSFELDFGRRIEVSGMVIEELGRLIVFSTHIDRRFDIVDENFRVLRKEMNKKFAALVDRIDRLTTHIAGFLKRYLRSV